MHFHRVVACPTAWLPILLFKEQEEVWGGGGQQWTAKKLRLREVCKVG
jgi:hypothetical protein